MQVALLPIVRPGDIFNLASRKIPHRLIAPLSPPVICCKYNTAKRNLLKTISFCRPIVVTPF